jgi:hypothetical protein
MTNKSTVLLIFSCLLCNLSIAGSKNLLLHGDAENGNIWKPEAQISTDEKKSGQASFALKPDGVLIVRSAVIPIDPAKTYRLSGWFKSASPERKSATCFGLRMLTEKKQHITSTNVTIVPESDTEIVEDAPAGVQSLLVRDASKWLKRRSVRSMVAFQTEPDGSDIPNFNVSSLITRVKKKPDTPDFWEIQLERALAKPVSAGTKVRQHLYGGACNCAIAYRGIPAEWTFFSATLSGKSINDSPFDKFWPGTVAVEVFVLANASKNGSELFFDDLLFEEITEE